MMILAGEAIGRWKIWEDKQNSHKCSQDHLRNLLRIPFRTQPSPGWYHRCFHESLSIFTNILNIFIVDYRSRMREKSIMEDLAKNDIGGGLCHAWYARRFLSPVEIREVPSPHFGLGIECYTQWSSPIRRFGDLQVHITTKRYLRRKKLIEMKLAGSAIPANITFIEIGCDPKIFSTNRTSPLLNMSDTDVDFTDNLASLRAARVVQQSSETYWMLEFIRRMDRSRTFESVILGCRNPARKQYMIYIYELGLEWQYTSPVENLTSGTKMVVKANNILPHDGQMTLVRVQF